MIIQLVDGSPSTWNLASSLIIVKAQWWSSNWPSLLIFPFTTRQWGQGHPPLSWILAKMILNFKIDWSPMPVLILKQTALTFLDSQQNMWRYKGRSSARHHLHILWQLCVPMLEQTLNQGALSSAHGKVLNGNAYRIEILGRSCQWVLMQSHWTKQAITTNSLYDNFCSCCEQLSHLFQVSNLVTWIIGGFSMVIFGLVAKVDVDRPKFSIPEWCEVGFIWSKHKSTDYPS